MSALTAGVACEGECDCGESGTHGEWLAMASQAPADPMDVPRVSLAYGQAVLAIDDIEKMPLSTPSDIHPICFS